jgi:acetyl-CoA carboxylase carboxyl transferase subunit alpha
VISPEGCAAILWKNSTKAPEAAEVLKLTAQDLLKMEIIDEVIPEPLGGCHRAPEKMSEVLKATINKHLKELLILTKEELVRLRYNKFRKIGIVQ